MFSDLEKKILLACYRHSGQTIPQLRAWVGEGVLIQEINQAVKRLREVHLLDKGKDRAFHTRLSDLKFYFTLKYELYARNS
jgi:hypothetical protein